MTVTFTDPPVLTHGRFGAYGGQYVPETIMPALDELEMGFRECLADDAFQAELRRLLRTYVGRPTPLYAASRFAEQIASGPVWLKREDLAHTGAHKINNAIGQGLLAQRMGKRRIIAETGAGQHGVDRYRVRHAGPGLRGVHGRGGHAASGDQRVSHAPVG